MFSVDYFKMSIRNDFDIDFSKNDRKEMLIEVEFEGLKTTFTIADHKINDHYDRYDRDTEDGGSKASIKDILNSLTHE